ncbi:TIGR00725 family protein [Halomarina litorea]|uniref:TIGR00725 family protein n=1 Tax=Halomarina litorea TaxID=2961595 RepID=UPI0020C395D3|nr:TIGR00725 family protein [Halomarina sp. BCD28]
MHVSVIGSGTASEGTDTYRAARAVGRELAERGHTVVCGGLGGVMAAACRGAREAGGKTVGILPGSDPRAANQHVTTPVATGMGNARNVLVVLNGRGVVAVGGATGTLSELGHALDFGRPVAGLDTHDLSSFDGFEACGDPEEAVESVLRRV